MKQLQKKRFNELIKRANPKLKDWQKLLAEPVIELALAIREEVGKDKFKKSFKKADNWVCNLIEHIATGKPAIPTLKETKKAQPSTEVFVPTTTPAKKKATKIIKGGSKSGAVLGGCKKGDTIIYKNKKCKFIRYMDYGFTCEIKSSAGKKLFVFGSEISKP